MPTCNWTACETTWTEEPPVTATIVVTQQPTEAIWGFYCSMLCMVKDVDAAVGGVKDQVNAVEEMMAFPPPVQLIKEVDPELEKLLAEEDELEAFIANTNQDTPFGEPGEATAPVDGNENFIAEVWEKLNDKITAITDHGDVQFDGPKVDGATVTVKWPAEVNWGDAPTLPQVNILDTSKVPEGIDVNDYLLETANICEQLSTALCYTYALGQKNQKPVAYQIPGGGVTGVMSFALQRADIQGYIQVTHDAAEVIVRYPGFTFSMPMSASLKDEFTNLQAGLEVAIPHLKTPVTETDGGGGL